ncbi:VOC family protein [Chitinophaga sp. XS-30]|uniref:VOC family protein n=1 Tax=Chitinophaga sp. XS-30 TaxID=2604421 RepID=UPI0011DDA3C8|nr:VOC family protein [Chitinophaga sp. XS-30]QEH41233.1 VOC family protein [Chitinophaga sp. XS-30]
MATVNPYLNFAGNTEEAFNFYKSVFGGEFSFLQRFKDTPHAGELPAEEQDKIMHIALPIGENMVLMATDTLKSMGQSVHPGDNMSLAISPDNREDTERYFNALADGGKVVMPLEDVFWGAYFGMLVDKFGIQWMVNFEAKQ